jgi:hypothetical protein
LVKIAGVNNLSSRGFFVGQIIDDLDAIASQVHQRCQLGQTDLNRILEDFFKEILNIVHNSNLVNLNTERSNEPGIDIGDKTSSRKFAYQITSQASAAKVNSTLEKITPTQIQTYDQFFVLIIGRRQKSYSLKPLLKKKCNFTDRNIIGIAELCRDIMDCDLAAIQSIHHKLTAERRRIKIELEPEIGGKFATTISDLVETRPSVQRSDGTRLATHSSTAGLFESPQQASAALNRFVDQLQKLPRLTREFLGWLIDNSDQALDVDSKSLQINADYVSSMRRDETGLMADIRLLEAWDFVRHDQDERQKSGYFTILFPGAGKTDLREAFIHFIIAENVKAASLFSTMNFTVFGPAPVPSLTPPTAKIRNKSKPV